MIKNYKIVKEIEALGNSIVDFNEPLVVTCKKTGENILLII